jgi:uncharacterized protein (TIGR02145 family)
MLPGAMAEDKNTTNDPCPAGWRVPSLAQWGSIFRGGMTNGAYDTATANNWTWQSSTTTHGAKVGNFLFLPAAGSLTSIGSLENVGLHGIYWSSTPYNSRALDLYFINSSVYVGNNNDRADGFSVRCVAE